MKLLDRQFPLVTVGQNQWYHSGIGAPPLLVYFCGDWDVHWGYGILTHGHIPWRPKPSPIVRFTACGISSLAAGTSSWGPPAPRRPAEMGGRGEQTDLQVLQCAFSRGGGGGDVYVVASPCWQLLEGIWAHGGPVP